MRIDVKFDIKERFLRTNSILEIIEKIKDFEDSHHSLSKNKENIKYYEDSVLKIFQNIGQELYEDYISKHKTVPNSDKFLGKW